MLSRRCLEFLSFKSIHLPRSVLVLTSQTTSWFSTSSRDVPLEARRKKFSTMKGRSAWTAYVKSNYRNFLETNPNIPTIEAFSKLYEQYKNAPETPEKIRSILEESRLQVKLLKEKELLEYYSRKAAEARELASNKRKMENQQLKALGKPKRCPTAYVLFCTDYAKKNPGTRLKGSGLFIREIANAWKDLPPTEKSKWFQEADIKKEEHKQMIAEWEADMIERGFSKMLKTK